MLDSNDLRQISEIVTTAVCASEERLENRIMVGVGSLLETTVLPQLDDLHSEVKSIRTDVTSLRTDVTTLRTDVTALQADVTILRTDVTTLRTDVDGLRSEVDGIRSDVGDLRTDVNGIRSKMATHYDLTVLRGDMNARFGTLCGILENKQVFTPTDSQTVRQA